jgi:Bacterial Ig domain
MNGTSLGLLLPPPPPDAIPPSVSITSPTNTATVSGNVSVLVSASDNVGVASVSLTVDGQPLGNDTSTPYSFAWGTAAVPNGTHTLTATASDAAGNAASSSVLVTVSNTIPDTTPPTVSITSPTGGNVSGLVSVLARATDGVGVVKVDLYVDGAVVSTATSSPFTNKWNSKKAASGAHTLQCRAYDAAGNVGVSTVVTVYK